MKNSIAKILEMLKLIETKGDSTILMAQCLQSLYDIYLKLDNSKEE